MIRKTGKRLNEMIGVLLIVYMFYKVVIDKATFGMFKIVLICAIILGFFAFWQGKKVRNSDIVLLASFVLFAFYILLRSFGSEFVFFRRALYEYIIYMMIIFLSAYIALNIDLDRIYGKIKYFAIFLPLTSYIDIWLHQGATFRSMGISRSEMVQGMLLGIYAIILLYYYYKEKKMSYIIIFSLSFIALFSTGSRGPLVATVVASFFVFLCNNLYEKNYMGIFKVAVIIIIAVLFVYWFFSVSINTGSATWNYWISRAQKIIDWQHDAGNYTRSIRWKKWFGIFKENILWGIGPSKTGSWNIEVTRGVTESGHLRHLVELGVVGSILYYFPILFCLLKAIRKMMREKEFGLIVLHVAIIICVLVENFVLQITEEITVAFFLWWSLGIIYALSSNDHFDNLQKNGIYRDSKQRKV